MNSNTPRTDEMERLISPTIYMVKADFARQLERELAESRQISKKYEDRAFQNLAMVSLANGALEIATRELTDLQKWCDDWRECAENLIKHVHTSCGCGRCKWCETVAAFDKLKGNQ